MLGLRLDFQHHHHLQGILTAEVDTHVPHLAVPNRGQDQRQEVEVQNTDQGLDHPQGQSQRKRKGQGHQSQEKKTPVIGKVPKRRRKSLVQGKNCGHETEKEYTCIHFQHCLMDQCTFNILVGFKAVNITQYYSCMDYPWRQSEQTF